MKLKFSLPKIIGHRGARGHSPENTLSSFQKAYDLGAKWVELDTKETLDGILIVMHDDDIDRTTNGTGKVTRTNWKEIQKLDAGSWFSEKYKGEKVPSLEQSVNLFSKLHLGVNIEIKPCPNKEKSTAILVAEFVKNQWPKGLFPPLISSFNMESLYVAKNHNPDIMIGTLYENELPSDWKKTAEELEAKTINLDKDIVNEKMIYEIKNAGYEVLIYTVNEKSDADKLFSMGVSSIFTDFPDRMQEFIK